MIKQRDLDILTEKMQLNNLYRTEKKTNENGFSNKLKFTDEFVTMLRANGLEIICLHSLPKVFIEDFKRRNPNLNNDITFESQNKVVVTSIMALFKLYYDLIALYGKVNNSYLLETDNALQGHNFSLGDSLREMYDEPEFESDLKSSLSILSAYNVNSDSFNQMDMQVKMFDAQVAPYSLWNQNNLVDLILGITLVKYTKSSYNVFLNGNWNSDSDFNASGIIKLDNNVTKEYSVVNKNGLLTRTYVIKVNNTIDIEHKLILNLITNETEESIVVNKDKIIIKENNVWKIPGEKKFAFGRFENKHLLSDIEKLLNEVNKYAGIEEYLSPSSIENTKHKSL